MDYNQIIVELFDRIKTLEARVSKLELEIGNNKPTVPEKKSNSGQKYRALTNFLKKSETERIELSFCQIEDLIGFELSPSARNNRANWANSTSQSLACSWLKAGYKTVEVDLSRERVVFEKQE